MPCSSYWTSKTIPAVLRGINKGRAPQDDYVLQPWIFQSRAAFLIQKNNRKSVKLISCGVAPCLIPASMIKYRPLEKSIGDSSNGRTAVSGTASSGSNPLSPAGKRLSHESLFICVTGIIFRLRMCGYRRRCQLKYYVPV